MHYKIVGVNSSKPDHPMVYRGSFTPVSGEHQILTAMVQQFGKPGELATKCLAQWSGGEVRYWVEDLAEAGKGLDQWEFLWSNTTFYVFLGAGPLE